MWNLSVKSLSRLRVLSQSSSFPSQIYTPSFYTSKNYSSSSNYEIPYKRTKKFLRRLLFIGFLSVGTFAGAIYTFQSVRNYLVTEFPSIKPVLNKTESLIGGWFSFKIKPQKSLETEHLPFQSESTRQSPEHVRHPTVDEVREMISQKWTPIDVDLNHIPELVQETEKKVIKAEKKLKELEIATHKYIDALRVAVQENKASSKEKQWDIVCKLETIKNNTEEQVQSFVEQANQQLYNLRHVIDQYKNTESAYENEIIPNSIDAHGKLKYNLTGAINQVRSLQNDIAMLKRYRDLISAAHLSLQEDLSSLLEHVDLESVAKEGTSMNVEELNRLVSVAHSRIVDLQSKLNVAEKNEKERLKSALDAQKRADESLFKELISRELEFERDKQEIEKHKWELETRDAMEKKNREALVRHSEHLSHMIQLEKEKMEYQRQFDIREAVAQERIAFETDLMCWKKRMEAIEYVIDDRAELDRLAKESQSLWLACEAMASRLTSTIPVDPSGKSRSASLHTGSLRDFLDNIREAASTGDHPFALMVLDSLSPEIVDKGVWMESGLKQRFEKVYKVCRRVALVDETSGSLWNYALSWLQSVLIFDLKHKCLQALSVIKPDVIGSDILLASDSELNEKENSDLIIDTFTLLSSAKLALDTDSVVSEKTEEYPESLLPDGGIELAVRLLGQLNGQARLVANDWLADARSYLEAKQTIQVLLAYAAARGITTFQKRL